jgi:hypothetical protein
MYTDAVGASNAATTTSRRDRKDLSGTVRYGLRTLRSIVRIGPVTVAQLLAAVVAFLACACTGGGLYEVLVLDPVWPNRPAIIQPRNGGVSRRRFWIPLHTTFEVALVVVLVACWAHHGMRTALLVALASHLVTRVWSFVDFIPKATKFEKDDPATIEKTTAQRWTRRSLLRLPLDVVTSAATLAALALA